LFRKTVLCSKKCGNSHFEKRRFLRLLSQTYKNRVPLGVEHKETGLLSLAPAAVLNITLMPVGVEHPMIFKTTDQGTV
ncbi:hypothetical protein, partial [Leptospira interrogans]|uniref:hypothetical protein n=1 Tax=Leptospira interrogans TaxID=173 RepID=UPI001F2D77C0